MAGDIAVSKTLSTTIDKLRDRSQLRSLCGYDRDEERTIRSHAQEHRPGPAPRWPRGASLRIVAFAAAQRQLCTNGSTAKKADGPGDPDLVAQRHRRSGQGRLAVGCGGLPPAHPNVTIKVNPIQNEQSRPRSRSHCNPATRPTSTSSGAVAVATQIRSGKLMDITERGRSPGQPIGPRPRRAGGQRQAVRRPVRARTSSASGTARTCSPRPASPHRRRPWTNSKRTSTSSRRPASPRSRWAARTSGRTPSGGTTSRSASAREPTPQVDGQGPEADRPVLIKAGEDLKTFLDSKPFQKAASWARPPSRAPAARPAWSPTARRPWSSRVTGS